MKNDFVAQAHNEHLNNCISAGSGFQYGETNVFLWLDAREILKGEATRIDYLFRRFGYPFTGCDSDKQIAQYIITTPLPDIFLSLSVKAGYIDFGYCIPNDLFQMAMEIASLHHEEIYCSELEKEKNERYKLAHEALRASIKDLLRPIILRDCAFNIVGDVTDEVWAMYPEPIETRKTAWCGLWQVAKLYETTDGFEALYKLLKAIKKSADGDLIAGMNKITYNLDGDKKDE